VNPQPYEQMDLSDLYRLMVWREAEGEGLIGKRGCAWSAWNRAEHPSWWGHDLKNVILHPHQYSSFNIGNPREKDWPNDDQPAFKDCVLVCNDIMQGADSDPTNGAQFYHDISIPTPKAWLDAGYQLTLAVGRFKFFREP
jgi:hypothetical protein